MNRRFLPLWLGLAAALLYLGAEIYLFERPAFPLDDSWIHLHMARGLSAGEGLVFNAGEPVSGSTAPLWTALVSIGFMLPGGLPLLWPKILGLVLLLVSLDATGRLGRQLGLTSGTAGVAQAMLLLGPWWLWSALSGMEILLFASLALLSLLQQQKSLATAGSHSKRSGRAAVGLAALSCLARPEGLLLLAGILSELALRRPGRKATPFRARAVEIGVHLALAAGILLPTAWFYSRIGGSPLPSTFAAKAHLDWNLVPSFDYLRRVLHIFWTAQPILTVLALVGGWRLLVTKSDGPRTWLPFLWLIGQPLAYAVMISGQGPAPLGNFGRYYFPLFPMIVLLGFLALEPWLRPSGRPTPSRMRHTVILALLLASQIPSALNGPGRYLQTVSNVEDSDVKAARWIAENLPSHTRVAAQDIGAVKFFLPEHQVIDLAGIVNSEVRALLADRDSEIYWEQRLAQYAHAEKVDIMVVFRESYPGLTRKGSGFVELQRFDVENNVTMAGQSLVVLKTPWSAKTGSNDRP